MYRYVSVDATHILESSEDKRDVTVVNTIPITNAIRGCEGKRKNAISGRIRDITEYRMLTLNHFTKTKLSRA
jgi:hypothetical protein